MMLSRSQTRSPKSLPGKYILRLSLETVGETALVCHFSVWVVLLQHEHWTNAIVLMFFSVKYEVLIIVLAVAALCCVGIWSHS